jgi:hypothetical protein
MMQFQNQFEAVEMATPLERMGSWKISPMMTHPAGPQVLQYCQLTRSNKLDGLLDLRGKEEDEKTHKDDQDIARRFRVFRDSTDNGDHELADGHANSAPNKQWPTTVPLNGVEGDGRRADVDDGGDD